MPVCQVCFRHCRIEEGETGFCLARTCQDGKITAANYGKITAMHLDPIEKKPLRRFYPGTRILSVGSYGCNLRCPFCQNSEISWSRDAARYGNDGNGTMISPQELTRTAEELRIKDNIGVAFTYNEPLIGYEFVRDTAKLVREKGMKNVLVSNGTACLGILEEIADYIDAMNIDLKGFTDRYYRDVLKGDRQMVMEFITEAVRHCHVELTTLIIPGENDSEEEIRELSAWIASLETREGPEGGRNIPLHISRFFPRFHMMDRAATDVGQVYHLAETARENLVYVYTGNC